MSSCRLLTPEQKKNFLEILHADKLNRSEYPKRILDIPYGDSPWQVMDLYLPENCTGPFPLIVFIHGGGWESGSKDDTQVLPFLQCLSQGWAIISLEFRPVPHVVFPENLYDVKRALRFLGCKGYSLNVNPMRIVMAGASAGAHLALIAAYTTGVQVYEGDSLPITYKYKIIGVIDQFGVTDLLARNRQFDESGYARFNDPADPSPSSEDRLMGISCSKIPALVRFANPIDLVHPEIPPTLIQHGRYDPMVPYQQSTELARRIEEIAGAQHVRLYINKDCTHGDPKFGRGEHLQEILDFLKSI